MKTGIVLIALGVFMWLATMVIGFVMGLASCVPAGVCATFMALFIGWLGGGAAVLIMSKQFSLAMALFLGGLFGMACAGAVADTLGIEVMAMAFVSGSLVGIGSFKRGLITADCD